MQHRKQTPRGQGGVASDASSRAVSEFLTGRRTIAEIAYGLNLPESTVKEWIRRASFEAVDDPARALARAEAEIDAVRAEATEALARAEAQIEASRAEATEAKVQADKAKKATAREKKKAADAAALAVATTAQAQEAARAETAAAYASAVEAMLRAEVSAAEAIQRAHDEAAEAVRRAEHASAEAVRRAEQEAAGAVERLEAETAARLRAEDAAEAERKARLEAEQAARAASEAEAAAYAAAVEGMVRAEVAAAERIAQAEAVVATARLEASEGGPAARAGGPSLSSAVGPDLPTTQSGAVAQAELTELVSRLAPVWAVAKGRTVAEAVANALAQLGVDEDEAEIEVISEGSRWGHRSVRIRARIRIAGERPRAGNPLVSPAASLS
jgi:hypothetical protein